MKQTLSHGATVAASLLLFAHHATGTVFWSGSEGLWNEARNWNNGAVPTAGDEVRISLGTAVIDSSASSFSTYISYTVEESATVKVIEGAAMWGNQGGIYVGGAAQGTGRLSIEAGTVSTGWVSVAGARESVGEVEVKGPLSLLAAQTIGIGAFGEGSLLITDGGRFLSGSDSNTGASIGVSSGYNTEGKGRVTITGDGSRWEHIGKIVVGFEGTGEMSVTSAAFVKSDSLSVGASGGIGAGLGVGSGTVVVHGASSSWSNSGSLTVGVGATGTLRIEAGATFTSGGEMAIGGRNGSIVVTGNGSRLGTGGSFTRIGEASDGSLLVLAGGTVVSTSARTLMGVDRLNGKGSATVSGVGSLWSNTGMIDVGSLGRADLTVENGGKVSASSVTIAAPESGLTNAVTLSGTETNGRGVLETSAVNIRSNGQIGTRAFIFDGGVLRSTGDQSAFLDINAEIRSGGAFLDSNGFAIATRSKFSGVGGLTKIGQGTLTLQDVSSYSGPTTVQEGVLKISGPIPSLPGHNRLPTNTALVVGNPDESGSATFDLNQYNQQVGSLRSLGTRMSRVVTNSGAAISTLTIQQNIDTVFAGQFTGNLNLIKSGPGVLTLTGENTHSGLTTIKDGTLIVEGSLAGTVALAGSGALGGSGAILGDLSNLEGTVRPGSSPGILKIDGNFVQGPSGRLQLEIGGRTPGAQHDLINVTQRLDLDGAIEVVLIEGFVPVVGDSFDLIDWGSLGNRSASWILPSLSGELVWDASTVFSDGTLRVVPESATTPLFMLSALVVASRRLRSFASSRN